MTEGEKLKDIGKAKRYVLRWGLKRERVDEAERDFHAMGLCTKKNFQMFW